MTNADRAEIRQAVMGVLLTSCPGWTTSGVRVATNRILATIKQVQDRQRRRAKRGVKP